MKNNAGIVVRFFANLIDKLIFTNIFLFIVYLMMNKFVAGDTDVMVTMITFILSTFFLWGIVNLLISVLLVSGLSGTFGKLLLGLRISDSKTGKKISKKTAFYRITAGYAFSRVLFGLGFWRIIKNEENLGWHDELFGTKVEKVSSPILGYILYILLLIGLIYLIYQISLQVVGLVPKL